MFEYGLVNEFWNSDCDMLNFFNINILEFRILNVVLVRLIMRKLMLKMVVCDIYSDIKVIKYYYV